MPLILDPDRHTEAALETLANEFIEALIEMREGIAHPAGRVLDPGSMDTARELIEAALARIRGTAPRTRAELAARANLGYATMVAVVDLVKSHTDVPRVPRPAKDRREP